MGVGDSSHTELASVPLHVRSCPWLNRWYVSLGCNTSSLALLWLPFSSNRPFPQKDLPRRGSRQIFSLDFVDIAVQNSARDFLDGAGDRVKIHRDARESESFSLQTDRPGRQGCLDPSHEPSHVLLGQHNCGLGTWERANKSLSEFAIL